MEIFGTVIQDSEIIGITDLRNINHRDNYTSSEHRAHALEFTVITKQNFVKFTSRFFAWHPDVNIGPSEIKTNLDESKAYNEYTLRYCEAYLQVMIMIAIRDNPAMDAHEVKANDYIKGMIKATKENLKKTNDRLKQFITPRDN